MLAVRSDANAVIVALPADHVIEDGGAFAASVALAVAAAEGGWLTILGLRPRHASTALGYIVPAAAIDGMSEIHRVSRFVEKPDAKSAGNLIAAGALWNAGIVVARADTVIDAMRKHEPAVLAAVERSLEAGAVMGDDLRLDAGAFAAAPRISFDKAVLERHDAVAVTALDAIWRDIGTWAEVAELYSADEDGNRQNGRVNLSHSHGSFVFSPHRLTVGIGLKGLVVVDTEDALLIANRDDLWSLPDAVQSIASGLYREEVADNPDFSIKQIVLHLSEKSIRQPHRDSTRYWIVLEGSVRLTVKGKSSIYLKNESFHVPPGLFHTLGAMDSEPVKLIEIQVVAKRASDVT
jgi:mannose-1-phosphate guanylyltransferase/mannose-6-phosphate isomerase